MRGPVATRERDVIVDCKVLLDFFKHKRLLDYWRISVGGILRGGNYLTPNKEMAGFSDTIILFPTPKTIFVEFKNNKGKQSENQKQFQSRIEAMGHKYYLCRSREALCEILKENGVMTNLFFR